MQTRARIAAKTIFFTLMALQGAQALAQSHVFTDLNPGSGLDSTAHAINNLGVVVGEQSITPHSPQYPLYWVGTAVSWRNGQMTELTPEVKGSGALDINDEGRIVGYSLQPSLANTQGGRVWENGKASPLNLMGPYSQAYAINSVGVIVGVGDYYTEPSRLYQATVYDNVNDRSHYISLNKTVSSTAFGLNDKGDVVGRADDATASSGRWGGTWAAVWRQGQQTLLDVPTGASASLARAINNAGRIVGTATIAGNQHAIQWDGSVMVDLAPAGWANSSAMSLNQLGQIVGSVSDGKGLSHAFMWDGASAVDLNSLLSAQEAAEWVLESASDINDHGVIVGSARNLLKGYVHAFTLAPVPEPATWAMWSLGLLGVAAVARRRRA